MELQDRYADLQARGIGLAAIFYDPPEVIRDFAAAREIEFPMLSDAGSAVITRYGILNREIDPDAAFGDFRLYGIPYPGTFVLDAAGRVVERFFEQRYQERSTASSIALRLGEQIAAASDSGGVVGAETGHLAARAFASDTVVAPGNRFSLVVDVTPKPGMHVYAPGDHLYRVVRLRIDAPDFLRVHAPAYPPSEIYHYEPLDETVPVYQRPFRLVQDVTIPMTEATAALAAAPGAVLTVEGALEYQACDDEVCYVPAEVPFTWEFAWRPLVLD